MKLSESDFSMILESLDYTEQAFRDYTRYPSYEFKQKQIGEVQALKSKLREIRKEQRRH